MSVWNDVAALISGQGTVFWEAAAAAALGAALLMAAASLQLRRWRAVRAVRAPRPQPADRPAVARATSDGYEPAVPVSATPGGADGALLLARLRAAGDRLASLQNPADGRNSRLKEAPAEVDYVFRSGVG